MSSRKSKEKYHQLVFSEVCLEHVQVICWILFEVFPFLPILVLSEAAVFQ